MDPNERLTGIASMMPQGGAPAPMAPPPMPQSGMGGPPPMPMGGGEPPMDPMMGGGEPPMEPEMGGGEPPMNVEQDAMMLAEAVVGRTQGDIGAAVDVLDTAKAMLISSGNQEPQMMNMGGPLYAESGTAISNEVKNTDTLRQMIMDDLAQMAAAATRPDLEGRAVSEADMAYIKNLLNEGQEGRTMSDIDFSKLKNISPSYRLYEKMKKKENVPPVSRAGGGTLMSGDYLSAEDAINSAMRFAKS